MAYYLGIDGGGSKTTCLVGDENTAFAGVTAGPSNITRVGEVRARRSLHQAIRGACTVAQIDPQQIQRVCIGAAGAGREEVASALRTIIAEVLPCETQIVGDMHIALEAAFGDGPGVIVIAGTGSIAYGRDTHGQTARAGGWGFAISDEGSAHWIGREAITALLRAADQDGTDQDRTNEDGANQARTNQGDTKPSSLFREISWAWKVTTLQELATAANSAPDFAKLLPAILAAAMADPTAQQILAQAAAELSRLAVIVFRRLFPEINAAPQAVPLALAGGVFRYSPLIREQFSNLVRTAYAPVVIGPEVVEPVRGALQMARKAAL